MGKGKRAHFPTGQIDSKMVTPPPILTKSDVIKSKSNNNHDSDFLSTPIQDDSPSLRPIGSLTVPSFEARFSTTSLNSAFSGSSVDDESMNLLNDDVHKILPGHSHLVTGSTGATAVNTKGDVVAIGTSGIVDPTKGGESMGEVEAPLFTLIATYISYLVIIMVGHMRDFYSSVFHPEEFAHLRVVNGYAPITSGWDTFYHRRLYLRLRTCFNRVITNVPSRTLFMLERNISNEGIFLTGKSRELLNLSSYNYLGFAQSEGPCADAVETTVEKYGIAMASPRRVAGTSDLHQKVESLVAEFVGAEDALIVSMGFATNSTTLPSLVSKGTLVISDELNHSSLIFGCRLSGASIKTFPHNDTSVLEKVIRDAISQGQPRTHRPWKKILIVVEGLYSMEGTICALPQILALKKKYKFYLYVDEAHSVGAMGPNGRGICDYFGVDPREVDILMGTFTKSFGAAGGYIAGKKEIIDRLRIEQHSATYSETVSFPVLQQIYTSMAIIMGNICGDEGRTRIQILARNARYFSDSLKKMGFIVYGDPGSPVVPLLLFQPSKILAFSNEMLQRGIAVVVVGYPATPIISSRVRFCLSASHTIEDMDYALKHVSEVGDLLSIKYLKE